MEPLEHLGWGFVILLGSLVAESISLVFGLSAVRRSARKADQSVGQYLRTGPDPMGVAVVLEDASAVIGLLVALTGLGLAELTGNPAWDGAASVAIGLLIGASAIFLINRNRHARMLAVLEENPVVARVQDVKVSQLGADAVRFKAEVTFDGRELLTRSAMK
ncbi:MAG: hypothetical protein JRI98_08685 [Deltaproteobacteria bacterium]|nr:hypothetical protein [Deltaproteobacteria bacterium]